MRRTLLLLAVVACLGLAAICLAGCGPTVNIIPHSQAPVITPDADSAVIYILRPGSLWGAALNLYIYEDLKPIGIVSSNSYFVLKTTPGKHVYHGESIGAQTSIDVQNGETYYLEMRLTYFYPITSVFEQITEATAKAMLPRMKYVLTVNQ